MQSLVTALRALIMLAVLIACPVLALQGVKPPERVKELLAALQTRALAVVEQVTQPSAAPPVEIELPLRQPVAAMHVAPAAAPVAMAIPTEYQAPPWTTTAATPPALPTQTLPTPMASAPAPPSPVAADPFQTLQQRLRELGASAYMLETWGTGGDLYRFSTDVAVQDDPNFHRNFQAIQESPLAAMQEVLAQVEAWRAGAP